MSRKFPHKGMLSHFWHLLSLLASSFICVLIICACGLQQSSTKEKELTMLKERLATINRDHEQTRGEISTARIENARLTAERQTLADKVQ